MTTQDRIAKAIHEVKKAFNNAVDKLDHAETASVAHDLVWHLQRVIERADKMRKEEGK